MALRIDAGSDSVCEMVHKLVTIAVHSLHQERGTDVLRVSTAGGVSRPFCFLRYPQPVFPFCSSDAQDVP